MYVHDVGWQVPVLAALFTALGCGNIVTTSMTIPLKLRDSQTGQLKYRWDVIGHLTPACSSLIGSAGSPGWTNISGRIENAGTQTDRCRIFSKRTFHFTRYHKFSVLIPLFTLLFYKQHFLDLLPLKLNCTLLLHFLFSSLVLYGRPTLSL